MASRRQTRSDCGRRFTPFRTGLHGKPVKALFDIDLEHEWSKETKRVAVEVVTTEALTVRWELAGLYVLQVATNELRPAEGRKRKQRLNWRAKDIEKVRWRIRHYFEEGG
jgi:hypothetical protein